MNPDDDDRCHPIVAMLVWFCVAVVLWLALLGGYYLLFGIGR